MENQLPPQDMDAEVALLGSMLLSHNAIGDVVPIIHPSESHRLYQLGHRKLFEVLVAMFDRGEPVDLVTVRSELERKNLMVDVGGMDYVIQLAESVPSHLNAEHYARLVRDKSLLRDLIGAAEKIIQRAHAHGDEAAEILDQAEALLFGVTDQRISQQITSIRDQLADVFNQLESRDAHRLTGLPTGFIELDDLLSGLQSGEMIIVAARPSVGKTAFGLSVAENVAMAGRPCAFFSMEMSKQSVVQRLLCSRGRIDSHKMRRGMLSGDELRHLAGTCAELEGAPLYVDDTPGMSVLELRAKARRLKARHGIQGVFVDYLQLMTASGRQESRQQEVSTISRGLKALARELSIPVVVLAQLNRNPEGRSDGRPRMSDLRESGAIEQDADVIILLHREEYYRKEATPEELKGVAEIIVDKQRNGPTGIVKLRFDNRLTRFDNLSYAADPGWSPGVRETEYASAGF